jgi:two-component system, OmpR family, KDP operon response regulator KdpE
MPQVAMTAAISRQRVYVANLRKKLEDDPASPRHLVTEAGMGYRFVV